MEFALYRTPKSVGIVGGVRIQRGYSCTSDYRFGEKPDSEIEVNGTPQDRAAVPLGRN